MLRMTRKLAWILRFMALGAIAAVGVFVLNNLFAYEVSWIKFRGAAPQQLPSIKPGSSVVIVAPHPDDEALAVGGWLTKAAADGAKVHAILVTNGDNFTLETRQVTRSFKANAADYIENGKLRQEESIRASRSLNYATVDFLGFPDQGIWPIWEDHWVTAFRSPFTEVDRSPYRRSFRREPPYEGQVLVDELVELFAKYQPDFLIIPLRMETHPDHYGASLFSTVAGLDPRIGKKPAVFEYIVHRGGYPYPYGFHPYAFLPPPDGLLNVGLDWRSFSLDSLARGNKARALLQYRSQMFFAGYDLAGFYRRNEVASKGGNVFRVSQVPSTMVENGEIRNVEFLEGGARDPVGDTAARILEPPGDVKMIRVAESRSGAFAVATFNAGISDAIDYRIDVRAFADGVLVNRITYDLPRGGRRPGANIKIAGNNIEAALPPGFVGGGVVTFVEVLTSSQIGAIDRSAAFFEGGP